MDEKATYDLDNLPEDLDVDAEPLPDFDPIDPSEIYQVQVYKIEARDNPWYDPKKKNGKYRLSFEFVILNEGEFYGRRLWRSTGLSLKPTRGKYEATILYKIISAALDTQLTWDECGSFAGKLAKNLQDEILNKQVKVAIENIENPETKKISTKIKAFYPVKEELPEYEYLPPAAQKAYDKLEAKKAKGGKKVTKAKKAPIEKAIDDTPLEDLDIPDVNFDELIAEDKEKKK